MLARLRHVRSDVLSLDRGQVLNAALLLAIVGAGAVGLTHLGVLALHDDLVANDADTRRGRAAMLVSGSGSVLEGGSSPWVAVGAVGTNPSLVCCDVPGPFRERFGLAERSGASRGTHLILHEPLADVLVGAEGDVSGGVGLILGEAAADVLLPALRAHHLLLLLLLGEVELVHSAVAVLRGESGDRVRAGIGIDPVGQALGLQITNAGPSLVGLDVVA